MNFLQSNLPVILYAFQASTYVAAGVLSWQIEHKSLTYCYLTSALLHLALGASHFLNS